MYCLQAVIATESVLRELTATGTKSRIVPLGQHLSLLPMTNAPFKAVTVAGAPELDGFWKAPAGFDRVLAACSATGPLAYIEAEYLGGTGTQTAQVWDAGKGGPWPTAPDRGRAVADDRLTDLPGATATRGHQG
jgi:hypothetical protein